MNKIWELNQQANRPRLSKPTYHSCDIRLRNLKGPERKKYLMKNIYISGLKENTELDVRWEEHEDINDPLKCDKIWLNLSRTGNNSNDNLLTITIYLSTGRIQIQGKSLTEWGNKEFDIILRMIDSDEKINSQTSKESLHDYIDKVMKLNDKKDKKDRNKSTSHPIEISTEEKQASTITATPTKTNDLQDQVNTPREKSFQMIKSQVACLESDTVEFKQEISKSIEDIKEYIQKKDNDLMLLREKFERAQSNEKVNKQLINDLTLKQYKQDEEILKLKNMNKNQKHEIQQLKMKINNILTTNETNGAQVEIHDQQS